MSQPKSSPVDLRWSYVDLEYEDRRLRRILRWKDEPVGCLALAMRLLGISIVWRDRLHFLPQGEVGAAVEQISDALEDFCR